MNKKLVFSIILLYVSMCMFGLAEEEFLPSLPELSQYLIPTEPDGEYRFDEIEFISWDFNAQLDGTIRGVALGKMGTSGVISSSSSYEHCSDIISVYSNDGRFMYGYRFYIKDRRGPDLLFFTEKDKLCYFVSHNTSHGLPERDIIVLDQGGTGILEFYRLPSLSVLEDIGIEVSDIHNNPSIYIDPDSKYTISKLEPAKLITRQKDTGIHVTIYNHENEYNTRLAKKARINHYLVIGLVILVAFIFIALEGLERIKDGSK